MTRTNLRFPPEVAAISAENATTPGGKTELPRGFRVEFDAATRQLDDATLFGGSPLRVLRLSRTGQAALAELRAGPVRSTAGAQLARRLTDAGLAHPRPPVGERADVTVVIPAYDRPGLLRGCLAALGPGAAVVVVDDGSRDSVALAVVAAEHGARLIRRLRNGGPAAARNTALAAIDTEYVAFLDSDCVPPPGWLAALTAHLADDQVAAVAPRITALPSATSAGRYAGVRGCLDLGSSPARVAPGTRVSYVPTAALVVRRAALEQVGGFDEALRYGEDVDLIWRLHGAGWRVRYDPSVTVAHREPDSWRALVARRYRYGTSAAPLARRHSGDLAPLHIHPWAAATTVALVARRPRLAALTATAAALSAVRSVRRAHLPPMLASRLTGTALIQAWLRAGRYVTQFAAPAALALGPIAAPLLLAQPVTTWARTRDLDPIRFTAGHLADDIAYGAGVWAGCLRTRTSDPLRPKLVHRSRGRR